MWQVDVPLGEFYDAIVAASRKAKYLGLLTALVRDADSALFYEDISRYWDSLHDVTGPDVLFVLAGPNASTKMGYHGVPDSHEPIAYSSRGAAVISASERPLRPHLSHWAARAGTVRADCFRLLAVPKGTTEFQSLQRHIDVHLNPNGVVATAAALEAAWEAVFRAASEVSTLELSPNEKYKIFIAYESKDRWIAEHLHSALARHTSTFLDVRCLRPGDRWVERIRSAQDNAEMTVVLVGKSGATSWFQQAEYLRAIELTRANKQRLVPVYVAGSPSSAPYGLEGVQAVVATWASGLSFSEDEVRKTAADIAALIARQ